MTGQDPLPAPEDGDRRDIPAKDHDRGVSPIAGRLGGRQGRMVTLAALAVGCGAFLFATWERDDAPTRKNPPPDAPPREGAPFEPARRAEPPPRQDGAPSTPPPGADMAAVPAIDGSRMADDAPPRSSGEGRALAESARRAPLLAYSRSGRGSPGSAPDHRPLPVTLSDPPAETRLDQLLRPGPIEEARAGRLPDRNLLITAGTSIPCVLQTAMDSSTPGYVSCLVGRDVWSDNGAVVLMPRGTRIMGEHRSALETGRRRLFVLWTRAVTPEGVAVALASPAADALGRSGFVGAIDTHFLERFGGALLLSIVDDGVHAAAGSGQELRSTARVPSDAATVALQNSIGIPPTLRKAQGSEVSVFVARDLNFADVYRLRRR